MSTNNDINVPLSGITGSVNFTGDTSPTLTTPNIGVATATSLAFSPTTNNIIGTTSADNAAAGYVGEVISSFIPFASAISYTTSGTPQDLTSIVLSAGDWEVCGNLMFLPSTGYLVTVEGSLSLISGGVDFVYKRPVVSSLYWYPAIQQGFPILNLNINISTPTTVYLVGFTTWVGGVVSFCGNMYARRIR